jgi:hypothetical protein
LVLRDGTGEITAEGDHLAPLTQATPVSLEPVAPGEEMQITLVGPQPSAGVLSVEALSLVGVWPECTRTPEPVPMKWRIEGDTMFATVPEGTCAGPARVFLTKGRQFDFCAEGFTCTRADASSDYLGFDFTVR